jgi:hypothetical protein
LAYDSERLTAFELKRDAVDGFDDSVFAVEVGAEVFYFEKIAVIRSHSC